MNRTTTVSVLDAALRTGLAGGSQEMVSAFPGLAAEGRIDLAKFAGDRVTMTWPSLEVLERASF